MNAVDRADGELALCVVTAMRSGDAVAARNLFCLSPNPGHLTMVIIDLASKLSFQVDWPRYCAASTQQWENQ